MPDLDAAKASAEWRLSVEGRLAARALEGRLPEDVHASLRGSGKRKKHSNSRSGGAFDVDSGPDEVRRPVEPVGPEVRSVRRA